MVGLHCKPEKSELTPTQCPTFLGAAIDIPAGLAHLRSDRIDTVVAAAIQLRCCQLAPARVWLQFPGYLASSMDVLQDCRLLMRPFQLHLLRFYRPSRDPLTRLIPNPSLSHMGLARWTKRVNLLIGHPPAGWNCLSFLLLSPSIGAPRSGGWSSPGLLTCLGGHR